ncbi:hypothetical protein E2562_034496 [Oryza meyeriana var. granulata]|uniref:Uncharacterized protein n=1 Tax=Oryza meyeriana var. granulata TaxID=110450 RepID=A0A6G1CWE0_9ORYZ|nr:hypothetical protein E2562_034496 [Oryza meyeriana var. granulata]
MESQVAGDVFARSGTQERVSESEIIQQSVSAGEQFQDAGGDKGKMTGSQTVVIAEGSTSGGSEAQSGQPPTAMVVSMVENTSGQIKSQPIVKESSDGNNDKMDFDYNYNENGNVGDNEGQLGSGKFVEEVLDRNMPGEKERGTDMVIQSENQIRDKQQADEDIAELTYKDNTKMKEVVSMEREELYEDDKSKMSQNIETKEDQVQTSPDEALMEDEGERDLKVALPKWWGDIFQ